MSDNRVEEACKVMHDAYEAAALEEGWETQQRSRAPWADIPEANKATMRAAVSSLLAWLADDNDGLRYTNETLASGVERVRGKIGTLYDLHAAANDAGNDKGASAYWSAAKIMERALEGHDQ